MAVLSVGSPALADRLQVPAGGIPGQPDKAEASFTDLLGAVQKSQTPPAPPEGAKAGKSGDVGKTGSQAAATEGSENVQNRKTEKKPEETAGEAGKPSGEKTETGKAEEGTEETKAPAAESEEMQEALSEKAQRLLKEVSDLLDISEEDLEEVLDTLGLTVMDLLNPKIIPELVAEETGNDISAVLTDETLYETVRDITALVKEAGEELQSEQNLTDEEFAGLLERLPEETKAAPGTEENRQNFIPTEPIEDADTTSEDTVRTPAEAVKSERRAPEPDRQPEESEGLKVVADRTDEPNEAGRTQSGGRESFGEHAGEHTQDSGPQMNLFQQNLTSAVENAVSGIESNVTSTYTDVEQIISQIEDQIRVRITDVSQSLEMQLNPANLGRVEMHLTMKAGALTAQFEAENVHVREVMQSQAAELKHNLEQQGIRVESVEVTLRERGFEQNFMQENNQAGEQAMEEARKQQSRRMRRILFDGDGDAEDMQEGLSEAELLTRRMMELSGNRLDFQA